MGVVIFHSESCNPGTMRSSTPMVAGAVSVKTQHRNDHWSSTARYGKNGRRGYWNFSNKFTKNRRFFFHTTL